LPDEVVVHWGKPVTANGADVISVNQRTGVVTLWDSKMRGASVTIEPSSTFAPGSGPLANAIKQAKVALAKDKSLTPAIRAKALENLEKRAVQTRTVGAGAVKNSTLR
jgi:filamentous hemagglutinin